MQCLDGIVDRGQKCYYLTSKIMLEEPGAEHWRLVHGRLKYGSADVHPSLAHAWIDLGDGNIYDVHAGYLSFKDYRKRLVVKGLVVDHVYSHAEVVAWYRLTGRRFPWRPALCRTAAATFAFIRRS
jgi:hypothetical protein